MLFSFSPFPIISFVKSPLVHSFLLVIDAPHSFYGYVRHRGHHVAFRGILHIRRAKGVVHIYRCLT